MQKGSGRPCENPASFGRGGKSRCQILLGLQLICYGFVLFLPLASVSLEAMLSVPCWHRASCNKERLLFLLHCSVQRGATWPASCTLGHCLCWSLAERKQKGHGKIALLASKETALGLIFYMFNVKLWMSLCR